jgi:hypothetical protein
MKIRLFAWWTCSHTITERFKKQFIGSYFSDPNITFVTDDTYDYAIVFGYTKENLKTDKKHTIYFFMEPHWSQNWDREAYKKSSRVYCTSKELFGCYDEFIEHRSFMFYGGHGDEYFELDNILNYKNTDKPKKTSFVVTYRSTSPLDGTNKNNIYDKRVLLAEEILKRFPDVDVYGFLWEYSNYTYPGLKGTIYTKYLALNEYQFSIGIENSREKNYVTEKLYDSLLFNVVPVYCGAPNIEDFDDVKDMFIHINNINDTENALTIINSLDSSIYENKMKNIMTFKKNLFSSTKFSLWQKIREEVNK